jgi:hypothetical protein
MDLFAAGLIDHNVGEERDEFGRGMPRCRLAEHFAGLGVEGSVQRQGAGTKVLKTVPFCASRGQWQNRILAIQGLDGGLFIHAEHRGMRWRVQILRGRGEMLEVSPENIAWTLRALGLHTDFIPGGRKGLILLNDVRKKIHDLAAAYGVRALRELPAKIDCPLCAALAAQWKVEANPAGTKHGASMKEAGIRRAPKFGRS